MVLQVIDARTFILSVCMILFCIGAFLKISYWGISNRRKIVGCFVLAVLHIFTAYDSASLMVLSTNMIQLFGNGINIKWIMAFLVFGTSAEAFFYGTYLVSMKKSSANIARDGQKKIISNWAIAFIVVHLVLFWYLWPLWQMIYQILL